MQGDRARRLIFYNDDNDLRRGCLFLRFFRAPRCLWLLRFSRLFRLSRFFWFERYERYERYEGLILSLIHI